MRLLSWNINGLRSTSAKLGGLGKVLQQLDADIICFQEHKLRRDDLERELAIVDGWESYFAHTSGNTGYSGVATFCRRSVTVPLHAEEGLTGILSAPRGLKAAEASLGLDSLWQSYSLQDLQAIDAEGRCVITDHGHFVLFNIYGPAITDASTAEQRMQYKLMFYEALQLRVEQCLSQGRNVVVVGDLNICPQPLDSCCPDPEFYKGRRDRQWLRSLLAQGGGPFVDSFRHFHPARGDAYSCWNTASGARVNNYGSRIDLILVAPAPQGASSTGGQQQQQQQQGQHIDTGGQWSQQQGQAQQQQRQEQQQQGQHIDTRGQWSQQQGQAQQQQRQEQQQQGQVLQTAPSSIVEWMAAADIWASFEGSDHAPVWLDLRLPEPFPMPQQPPALSTSYQFKGRQAGLRQWLQPKPPAQAVPQAELPDGINSRPAAAGAGADGQSARPAAGSSQQVHRSTLHRSSSSGVALAAGRASEAGKAGRGAGAGRSGAAAKGQQSLLSMLQRRTPAAATMPSGTPLPAADAALHDSAAAPQSVAAAASVASLQAAQDAASAAAAAAASRAAAPNSLGTMAPSQRDTGSGSTTAADLEAGSSQASSQQASQAGSQQAAADAWRRISQAMRAPTCKGHREPCVIRTVKKKGDNNGRQFYVCARADGPAPHGRCDFFQWVCDRGIRGQPAKAGSRGGAAGGSSGSGGVGGKRFGSGGGGSGGGQVAKRAR